MSKRITCAKLVVANGAEVHDGSVNLETTGVAAPVGSLYLKDAGDLWVKTGAGDTAWARRTRKTADYNVLDYGAVGDGTTDDTQAIIDAYTAADTAGGGRVIFPPGTYGVSKQTSLAVFDLSGIANIVFEGVGPASIIQTLAGNYGGAGSDMYMFYLNGANSDRLTWRNLALDGNKDNVTSGEQTHLINARGRTDVRFYNVIFRDSVSDGIRFLTDADASSTNRFTVSKCFFTGNGRSDITVQTGTERGQIWANHFDNFSDQSVDFEPTSGDALHVTLFNNIVVGTGNLTIALSRATYTSYVGNILYGGSFSLVGSTDGGPDSRSSSMYSIYGNIADMDDLINDPASSVGMLPISRGFLESLIVANIIHGSEAANTVTLQRNSATVAKKVSIFGNIMKTASAHRACACENTDYVTVVGNIAHDETGAGLDGFDEVPTVAAPAAEHGNHGWLCWGNLSFNFDYGFRPQGSTNEAENIICANNISRGHDVDGTEVRINSTSSNNKVPEASGSRGGLTLTSPQADFLTAGGNRDSLGRFMVVSGSPESAITAPIGSTCLRIDGGGSTTLYVKESGVGNTGWVAK